MPLRLLLTVALLGCAGSPATTVPAPTAASTFARQTPAISATQAPASEPPRDQACTDLDSQLAQVVGSADPTSTARELGLRVEAGSVQVVLVLGEGGLDELAGLGVRPGSRFEKELQAFVPIHRLCEVAATDVVEWILVPSQAIPVN